MNTSEASTRWFPRLPGTRTTAAWAMVAAGTLWIAHGYFLFMMPYGPDALWREDLGYMTILSPGLFLLYGLPGVLAVLLTAWGLRSCLPALVPAGALNRAARILGLAALVFGVIAALGLIIQFTPLTIGGISFGLPALGLALFLAGLALGRASEGFGAGPGFLRAVLIVTGCLGMATLLVRPMIYALGLLPPVSGTAVLALIGVAWVSLGISMRQATASSPAR
ncbi:hypothetical protein [Pseudarthrobacter sp. DSP2-3-2b1]|uniref:hypothetical protein n=1 Tax=Pseudarthrobacter sp. DSP2-3-2b1 TaxID=2804661 RepID=UPI003CE87F42